jgi:hypothetical protein
MQTCFRRRISFRKFHACEVTQRNFEINLQKFLLSDLKERL